VLRSREHAVAFALVERTGVDENQVEIRPCFVRRVAGDPRAGVGEHLV
jgi:hypothetical protein